MLVMYVFLVMENKKALPDSWLPQHSVNAVSFTRSDNNILLRLLKKHTTYVAASFSDLETRTWYATPNYLAVLAFGTNFATNPPKHMASKIFWHRIFRSNTVHIKAVEELRVHLKFQYIAQS